MLKLSVVQFTPLWDNKALNHGRIASLIKDLESDIIVLPELCTTGYSFLTKAEALAEAEELDGKSIAFFRQAAIDKRAMIIAGFAEQDGENAYNSSVAALPDGSIRIFR